LGSTHAIIDGINHGVGFVLFIKDGFIKTLEGYTYDEKFPEVINNYSID